MIRHRILHITSPFFLLFFVGSYYFWNFSYHNTRKEFSSKRRLSISNETSIAKKNDYMKEGIMLCNSLNNNYGNVALMMNFLEKKYQIPYQWGGSIRNYSTGLDCSGFLHGIMYYMGEPDFKKRFNTYTLYKKLINNRDYQLIFSARYNNKHLDYNNLKIGDIILWPSGMYDGKNISGEIIGHVGIVSLKYKEKYYVTNYVDSPLYNNYDIIGKQGAGINTMDAKHFIENKKRGVLYVFRKN